MKSLLSLLLVLLCTSFVCADDHTGAECVAEKAEALRLKKLVKDTTQSPPTGEYYDMYSAINGATAACQWAGLARSDAVSRGATAQQLAEGDGHMNSGSLKLTDAGTDSGLGDTAWAGAEWALLSGDVCFAYNNWDDAWTEYKSAQQKYGYAAMDYANAKSDYNAAKGHFENATASFDAINPE